MLAGLPDFESGSPASPLGPSGDRWALHVYKAHFEPKSFRWCICPLTTMCVFHSRNSIYWYTRYFLQSGKKTQSPWLTYVAIVPHSEFWYRSRRWRIFSDREAEFYCTSLVHECNSWVFSRPLFKEILKTRQDITWFIFRLVLYISTKSWC